MSDSLSREMIESVDYETPFFLFSKNRIVNALAQFSECFPGAAIHYAMKANSESEVLRTLFDAGASFEVASVNELVMLKELRVPASKIIYGSSVKPTAYIKFFYEAGIVRFAFDSLPELEKIAAVAPGAWVYVRTSVDDTGSVFRFSEKFGTDRENIVPLLLHARHLGLRPYGISFHVGSQASNPMAWATALQSLAPSMEHLQKIGIELEIVNLGGGYPCAYASTDQMAALSEIAANTLQQYARLPYRPNLVLEPGRGIIADTAVLVSSVIARIERKGSTWLFLDVGVYNGLYEALAFQGATRYKVTSLRPSFDSGQAIFSLAGPTGDSPDVIMREALLPQDISVGDRLIFHSVGAYSIAVVSKFNGFPKPDVYFI
jgi:ornithine decarboxylase